MTAVIDFEELGIVGAKGIGCVVWCGLCSMLWVVQYMSCTFRCQ